MKAARFAGNGIVEIVEVPVPQIKENEILVKVSYCGLCGSEKRIVKNGFDKCIPGHEISGVIEKCGNMATQYEPGTPVLVYLSNYCGTCEACLKGNTSQCAHRRGLIGWSFDGGYAEYVAVPAHMIFPLGTLPVELGVLALDTIGTAFHGLRQADITSDNSALVIGCGPIGMGCLSILKNHYQVRKLYAADISPYHCQMAEKLGAVPIRVDPTDTVASIQNVLGEEKIDRVIEVCGIDATMAAAAKFVRAGGKIAFIGEPEKALTLVRSTDWVLKDFSLINSWYFPISELTDNISYIKKYQAEVSKLITNYFPLEQMTQAYAEFHSGNTGKVLIRM